MTLFGRWGSNNEHGCADTGHSTECILPTTDPLDRRVDSGMCAISLEVPRDTSVGDEFHIRFQLEDPTAVKQFGWTVFGLPGELFRVVCSGVHRRSCRAGSAIPTGSNAWIR